MEHLKQLSRSALLALAGILVVLLSLSQNLELGPLKYSADSSALSRYILLCIGVALLIIGLVTEFVSRRRNHSSADESPVRSTGSVDEIFKTLDDLPGFNTLTQAAARISILGRTAVNLLTSYQRTFQETCSAGCEVRLVFVDPTSEASRYLYGSQIDVYNKNLAASVTQISRLSKSIGPRLSVRTTTDVPPFSLVHVEPKEGLNFFRVQLNFMHSRIARDRPVFMVYETDAWYQAFVDEFDATWHQATDFDRTVSAGKLEE